MCGSLAHAFVATGGSQCGFCTPGILVRLAALAARGTTTTVDVDRALAAHLCRCTGWQTVYDAAATHFVSTTAGSAADVDTTSRDLEAAGRRAELEGGVVQRVGVTTPLGDAGFADDSAPRDALVAVPCPPGRAATVSAAGLAWVVGESLAEARSRAGKVQGRRTTVADRPPLALPELPEGGIRLATSWVEPAYLEPDSELVRAGGRTGLAIGERRGVRRQVRYRRTAGSP